MSNLEDGYVFSSGGIKNLLEGDFYSWYADDNQWNKEIFISIKNIITELENYSSSKFTYEFSTIDIFKDLYMEIMPNELRHSLGEYFTPSWLADNVVKKSIKKLPIHKKDSWKAIDPCCGSGVFVVSLIREIQSKKDLFALTSEEKSKLLDEILRRVQGIDLNPLSVLTSRVSYFLAILPLLENKKIEIEQSLLRISSNDRFLEEYNESFYTDLLGIANLSENTIKYSNTIFEKAYKKYSNKNIVKIYANFLIEIKEYRKAEDILMKYIVNSEDNLDEYALLKTLYTKENNKQKLESLKKILRNKI